MGALRDGIDKLGDHTNTTPDNLTGLPVPNAVRQFVGETVGRLAEGGIGMPADMASQAMWGLTNLPPMAMNWLTGTPQQPTAPMPPSAAGQIRGAFGIPPQEELPTLPQRVSALGVQAFGPVTTGAVLRQMGQRAAQFAKGPAGQIMRRSLANERGAMGPVAPVVGEAAVESGSGPIWRDPAESAVASWGKESGTQKEFLEHLQRTETKLGSERKEALKGWLADRPVVTKDEAMGWAKGSAPQLEEVVLGEPTAASDRMEVLRKQYRQLAAQLDVMPHNDPTREGIMSQINTVFGELQKVEEANQTAATKFDRPDLMTPGGSDYRELLLKVPQPEAKSYPTYDVLSGGHIIAGDYRPEMIEEYQQYGYEIRPTGSTTERRVQETFRSQHYWNEPNVLAHVRFNTRNDVAGNKTLFLEEVQSDWHHDLRALKELRRHHLNDPEMLADVRLLPNAPFKSSWPIVSMKRMIRWATDNGHDQIAWTTGQQQVDRYNLQLKGITRLRQGADGTVHAFDEKGIAYPLNEDQVQETTKLLGNRAPKGWGTTDNTIELDLTDNPLTIGGKWAENLYDKQIPDGVAKLIKKWGGKVEQLQIPGANTDPAVRGITVWGFKLTPAMREAAKRGMELSQADQPDQEVGVA
jgi:hypothetical protein